MAAGTVYPAKVALKALLESWSWPQSAPTISWGEPTKQSDISYEAIYYGTTEISDEFRSLGAGRSDETYRLSLVIDVRDYGDEQATEARAWELHDETLSLLRENMTLNGAISHITGYVVRQGNPLTDTEKWRTQIVIQPECVGFLFY